MVKEFLDRHKTANLFTMVRMQGLSAAGWVVAHLTLLTGLSSAASFAFAPPAHLARPCMRPGGICMTATGLRGSEKGTSGDTNNQDILNQKRRLVSTVRRQDKKHNTDELRLEPAARQRDSGSINDEERPVLICLPGLDGLSLPPLLEEQSLNANFTILTLQVPGGCMLDHSQIIDFLASQVKQISLLGGGRGPLDTIARAALDEMVGGYNNVQRSGDNAQRDVDWEQVRFRIDRWVDQGERRLRGQVASIQTETLIFTSDKTPSPAVAAEAARLQALLPHATLSSAQKLDRGGTEPTPSLLRLIRLSKLAPSAQRLDPILDFVPPPADTPPPQPLATFSRLVSPVWLSTDPATGAVEQGLQHLPAIDAGRPVLFVGNHQYLGIESAVLVSGIRQQTKSPGIVRALAHPFIFEDDIRKATLEGNFYANFGTVPVSPRNYHKLISNGRPTLLFPGGAPEAFHGAKDAYQLRWPANTDFLPLAARYNATIVPFGGVGAWEGFTSLGETEELAQQWEEFQAAVTKPLQDLNINLNLTELGVGPGMRPGGGGGAGATAAGEGGGEGRAPRVQDAQCVGLMQSECGGRRAVAVPNAPWDAPRFYFYFGKPIDTTMVDYKDKEQTAAVYNDIKKDVEDCIKYLLRKRLEDPYSSFSSRIQYELLTGKQAPTFDP